MSERGTLLALVLRSELLRRLAAVTALALAACRLAGAADVAGLAGRLPAQDPATRETVFRQLVAAGPNGIAQLASMLREPGKGDDSKARYALHGLAVHVSRPGADAERKMFSKSLAALLGRSLPAAARRFLVSQLQIAGGAEAVRALGGALFDPELCEYAARAIVAISDATATSEGAGPHRREARPAGSDYLRKALPKAAGRNRLAVIQALGLLRDEESVPALLRLAGSEDEDTRLQACFALAEIGDARARDALTKAASVEPIVERAKATDALLLLARRLVEEGRKRDAMKIYQDLWKTRTDAEEPHVRAAAMQGMAEAQRAASRPKRRPPRASRAASRGAAAAAAQKSPSVGPEVLAAWDGKLIRRLREASGATRSVSFLLESMRTRVKVVGVDKDGTVKVNARGAELGIAWERLKLGEKKRLAVALAGGDPAANALAAFYCLATGDKLAAGFHLRKAGEAGKEAEAAFE